LDTRSFAHGVKSAVPIVLGYIPIGFAYGVIARGIGLTVPEATAMSILVYAGSAQFIATGLLAAGAGPMTIIATTFLVNLRHLLMSAALLPGLRHLSPKLLAVLSFGITDESFAVASLELENARNAGSFLLGLNLTSYVSWIASSAGGAWFGSLFPDTDRFGLDFALPAMFIALLIFQIREHRYWVVAILAGIASVGLALLLPGNWNIILATLVGATVGMVMER